VKGRQKTAPLGAVFGVLSTAPQHVGPRRFRLLRQALTVSSLHVQAGSWTFLPPFPPPLRQGTYFGLLDKGPILAPRLLNPKWTSLSISYISWLAVYMRLCPHLSIALAFASLLDLPLWAWVFTLFPAEPEHSIMSEIPLQSRPIPHRQHWTVPVGREKTLAVRKRFRRVNWRAPNHKPKTTKIVT
jgi:hypothetical protein